MRRPRNRSPQAGRRRVLVVLAAVTFSAGWTAPAPAASSGVPHWPSPVDWQRDVEAPDTALVAPVRIVATTGRVTGASHLADPGGSGLTTLTRVAGGPAPSVVLDYGRDVGGIPFFVLHAAAGAPDLRSAFSEGLAYLGPGGDVTGSASNAGDAARVDDLLAVYPGKLATGQIQGGERFERISLASPGTVTLSSVGIEFTAVRATAADYRGWFASSAPELDRIWFDGAYTTQLNELPAGAAPPPWRIEGRVLDAVGGSVGVLDRGSGWTDYTMSFDTRVVDNEAGWVVRATSASSGYLFVLRDATTATGAVTTLSEVAIGPGRFTVVDEVTLPPSFVAGRWHHVATVASGPRITTSIDGRPVAAFDSGDVASGVPVYRSGTVGFAALGSAALFRGLVITAPGGTTRYTNALSSPAALADFPGPDVSTTNALPVITDGAKRDRVVWSGDLGVEVPDVFYSTAAAAFAKGSLALLGSYQVAGGQSGTNIDPTLPLGTYPESDSLYPSYSTSYSMDEVDNIATYYRFTGDLGFVRSEWPVITRQLAYDASLVDGRGLLVTDDTDGQDWDYYDGNKVGEVTAYNDLYYEALQSAASMAAALGRPGQAALDRRDAAQVATAINRYLYDPATHLYMLSNLQPAAVAQDANALAVLFGVAPAAQDGAVLTALARTLPSTPYGPMPFTANTGYETGVSPFVTSDEVAARFATGDTDSALSLLRTVWGHMDAPGPNDTGADWEYVGADGSPGFGDSTSLAHGWSSGATADLSEYVLGVMPASPGYATWTVEPHPGSLSWVEGDVPTPHGTLAVRWAQNRASGRFALQVTTPRGTRGTISVPVPPTGAVVTVRAAGPAGRAPSPRTETSAPGATAVTVAASGTTTYDIDVAPR